MRLRYEVFHREFQKKKFPYGLDSDAFDILADHLVIIDPKIGRIVGTYRLISTTYSRSFYSESEFTVANFLQTPGAKLEMSRACIHRNYRKGVVMTLLWRGLVEYVRQVEAKFLFGCASIKTMDPNEVKLVVDYLTAQNHVTEQYGAVPLPAYQMEGEVSKEYQYNEAAAKLMVPPLLNSYLRAGAKVAPSPALDRDFRCIDFFTVLNMEDLTRSFERKYTS
jgi:putative hemolysin